MSQSSIFTCFLVICPPHGARNYSSMISYFSPSLKYSQNTTLNVKIHMQYKLFTMKNILINLVLTNMAFRGWDEEDGNDMEVDDSKDCIISGKRARTNSASNAPCANLGCRSNKALAMAI